VATKFFDEIERPSLFSSPAWLGAWESAWVGPELESYVDSGPLFFYVCREEKIKYLPLSTIYPAASSSRYLPAIRCEYFQLPSVFFSQQDLWPEHWRVMKSHRWDQWVISDILKNSVDYTILKQQISQHGFYYLLRSEEYSYGVDVRQSFECYLNHLSKNTKIKLYNKRTKLGSKGLIEIKNMWPDKHGFIKILNQFHERRWGSPCYTGKNLNFIHRLLDNLEQENAEIDLSVMCLNGEPISAIFDIHYSGRIYNLQSGYCQQSIKNISLGIIHYGFQIEAACRNSKIKFYDFLAGRGKQENYKKSISTEVAEVVNILVVRSRWLYWIYKINKLLACLKRSG
jgi:hypothetical protein